MATMEEVIRKAQHLTYKSEQINILKLISNDYVNILKLILKSINHEDIVWKYYIVNIINWICLPKNKNI